MWAWRFPPTKGDEKAHTSVESGRRVRWRSECLHSRGRPCLPNFNGTDDT